MDMKFPKTHLLDKLGVNVSDLRWLHFEYNVFCTQEQLDKI